MLERGRCAELIVICVFVFWIVAEDASLFATVEQISLLRRRLESQPSVVSNPRGTSPFQ
jgi:hypothetical protein